MIKVHRLKRSRRMRVLRTYVRYLNKRARARGIIIKSCPLFTCAWPVRAYRPPRFCAADKRIVLYAVRIIYTSIVRARVSYGYGLYSCRATPPRIEIVLFTGSRPFHEMPVDVSRRASFAAVRDAYAVFCQHVRSGTRARCISTDSIIHGY